VTGFLRPSQAGQVSVNANPLVQEEVFIEGRDVFLGSYDPLTSSGSDQERLQHVTQILAEGLGLSEERRDWCLSRRVPELVSGPQAVKIGRVNLPVLALPPSSLTNSRPFALTKPALLLLEKLAVCVHHSEPVLLVGETGTGKTSAVGKLAQLTGKKLVSLNLSNQTEVEELIGGWKPVDEQVEANCEPHTLIKACELD
jgi:midasin